MDLHEVSPDKNWAGSIRAMLTKHPDKFSKEACKGEDDDKLCPYAIAWSGKKKGKKSHYKAQESSLKGKPKKKKSFKEWLVLRENAVPFTDEVDKFCWERLGFGGETLAKRVGKDKVVEDGDAYTVYKLGKTPIHYRVVEFGGIPGIRIDAIWNSEEE